MKAIRPISIVLGSRSTRLPLAASAAALLILAAPSLHATAYYWDTNGTGSGFGADPTGTWGTSNFWNTDSGGGSGTFSTSVPSGSDVNFGTSSAGFSTASTSVTISGTVDVNSITFGSANTQTFTLTGGTINIAAGGTIANNSSIQMNIGSVIGGGSGGFIINNSLGAEVNFFGAAAMTNTGAMTITSGTAAFNAVATYATLSKIILNGGTFRHNQSGNVSITKNFDITASGGTINLGANATTYTFSGTFTSTGTGARTLTLTGTPVAATMASVLADPSSGALSLTKAGTGTWNLGGSGANTYSGDTTISAGTLNLSTATAVIPSGAGKGIVIMNPSSGTATFSIFASTAINGLTSSGAGSSIVTSSAAGGTTRTLTVGTAGSNPSGTFAGVLQDNGTAVLALIKAGTGTLTLTNNSTYTGTTTVSAGTLVLAGGNGTTAATTGNIADASISVGASGTLQLQANGTNTASGSSSALAKSTQSNTNNAVLTMASGSTLQLRSDSAVTFYANIENSSLSSTSIAGLSGGGTLNIDVNRLTAAGSNNAIQFSTNRLAVGGDFTLNVTGGNGYSLTLNAIRRLASTNGNITLNPTLANLSVGNLNSGATSGQATTFILDGSTTGNSVTGVISNTSSGGSATVLTKSNTSTWTLSGSNTYSGGTTIKAGTLIIGITDTSTTVGGLGGSSRSVLLGDTTGSSNASLLINGAFTVGNDITVQTGSSSNTLTMGGSNTTGTAVFSGTIKLGTSGANPSKDLSLVAAAGGTVEFSGVFNENTSNTTVSNITVGDGTNTGTVYLSNTANGYSGVTTINGGTLQVAKLNTGGTNSSIGNSGSNAGTGSVATDLIINGGILKFTGTTGNGSTNRLFTIGTSGATIDASSSDNTALTFTGSGSLVASGTGNRTLTLTGTSAAATQNTLASIIADPTTGATSLTKSGSNTWILTGGNTYTGATNITGGTLQLGTGTASGQISSSSSISISSGAFLVINRSSNLALTMQITGAGSVQQAGTGLTALNSTSNNYSGNTIITQGTLNVGPLAGGGGQTIPTGTGKGNVVFDTAANSAIFNINQNNVTINGLVGGSSTTNVVANNNNTGTSANTLSVGDADTSSSFGGIIKDNTGTGGTLALTKIGAGTLTLSGANTYTGNTLVNGGILILAGSNSSSAATTVTGTGTLQLNSASNGGLASGNLNANADNVVIQAINADRTITNQVVLNANPIFSGSQSLTVGNLRVNNGNRQFTNNISGAGKSLTIATVDTDGSNARNLVIDGTGNTTVSGAVALASGTLTKNGNGKLTLSGTNSYTGKTTVSAGTLTLNGTSGGNSVIVATGNSGEDILISGGTLEIAASEQIADSSKITLSSGFLNFGSASGLTETVGTLTVSGTGSFTTQGNAFKGTGATITMSGGTTTVSDGGLLQDGHIVISAGTNTVQGGTAGGALELTSGGLGLEMSNGATLTLNSDNGVAGKLKLTGASSNVSVNDATTVNIANGAGGTNLGNIDLNGNNHSFSVVSGGTLNVGAQIIDGTGNGSITKAGAGKMTVSADNTYTGTTTVNNNGGTLEVTGKLSGTSGVTVNTGGTLLLNSAGSDIVKTTATVNLSGGTLAFGNAASQTQNLGSLTLSVNSTLDFGSGGGADKFLFSGISHSGGTLSILNWVGNAAGGTDGIDDRLIFSGSSSAFTSQFGFNEVIFNGSSGYAAIDLTGAEAGFYEIVPVPEPATTALIGAVALCALIGWRERRRFIAKGNAGLKA